MNRLLRLKNWQIFLISWGPLSAFFSCLFIQPDLIVYYFQFWFFLFAIGIINSFAWVWAATIFIEKKIPSAIRPNDKMFKICFWLPASYILWFVCFMLYSLSIQKVASRYPQLELKIIIVMAILSVCCIIYGLLFTAKIIKTAELQRNLKFYEYINEFILMILLPIGLWFIQPRLNKIITDNLRK